MRIFPRHELIAQRARDLERVCEIIATTGERVAGVVEDRTRRTRNTPADARVLRMIPVCAEGVPGTAPGTDPFTEYAEAEERAARRSAA